MTPLLEKWVLIPVMRVWHHARRSSVAFGPVPADLLSTHAPGADSDRVLVVGSGIAAGWGVLSQDMALPGHLARALSALTGRGTDVDVVATIDMTAQTAAVRLASVPIERYDAVVLVLGMPEAFDFVPVSRWLDRLAEVLAQVHDVAFCDVIVTGIPSLRSIPGYDTRLGLLAERHAELYNTATAQLAMQHQRTEFVRLSPTKSDPNGAGRPTENYRMWAGEIAAQTAPLLNRSRESSTVVQHDAAKSESERLDRVRRLGILNTEPEARFDRIVEQARILFDAGGAALAFIDGDRIWYKSVRGVMLPSLARRDSFTQATIYQRGAFMVPDARADVRFQNLPHVRGEPWVRFWAGFPIEDDGGVRVGTLSVFDTEPRGPTPDREPAILRQFALMIQYELRHPAPPSATPPQGVRGHRLGSGAANSPQRPG